MARNKTPDPEALRIVENAFTPRVPLLKELARNLQTKVEELLDGVQHVDRISFRAKKPDSFAKKALKTKKNGTLKYRHPLIELEDQVAGRVLVFYRADMAVVIERLKPVFNPVEHTPKRPKNRAAFAYESDHLVCTIPPALEPEGWSELTDPPTTFELQVRTLAMHAWAEPEHDITYKPGTKVLKSERRQLAWAAASAWGIDEVFDQVTTAIEKRTAEVAH